MKRVAGKLLGDGTLYVWLLASATSVSLLMVIGLMALIAIKGLGHFWPLEVAVIEYQAPGSTDKSVGYMGEMVKRETFIKDDGTARARTLVKTGNRDLDDTDFRWLWDDGIQHLTHPEEIATVERREWGNLYGIPKALYTANGQYTDADTDFSVAVQAALKRTAAIHQKIARIERDHIGAINHHIEQLRLEKRRLELAEVIEQAPYQALEAKRSEHEATYAALTKELEVLYAELKEEKIEFEIASNRRIILPLATVIAIYEPNRMTFGEKLLFYAGKVWRFLSEYPREANTEGGVYPAIFGTIAMVIIMAFLVTPLGVVAAVYLHEYAGRNIITRLVRIAVNNLAGVPSVVYGIFGLGFFVYFLGSHIDEAFFPEALPAPTFGSPGLLWASLTLALLTLPVVIVATEEGLSRVPRAVRESSLALGATKIETIWHTVLPLSAPALITGVILAVARAAGEVAPLLLVGVVKLAPDLPLDGNFPYLHPERKFMHLGFHIYDVGFQSPNVDSAVPLVYATAFLLIAIVVFLNILVINLRNRLQEKYRVRD